MTAGHRRGMRSYEPWEPTKAVGIVAVFLGVSDATARKAAIDPLVCHIKEKYPDCSVEFAYSSRMIRRILERRGEAVFDTAQALKKLSSTGVTKALVLPTHLIAGIEYQRMREDIAAVSQRFVEVRVGVPLLYHASDYRRLAHAVSNAYPRLAGEHLVLMGHGSTQYMNAAYPALAYEFAHLGLNDVHLGTTGGYPDFSVVLGELIHANPRPHRVILAPLLFVAGNHAQKDMAGERSTSWASQLRAAGFEVDIRLQGLGEVADVRQLYLDQLENLMAGKAEE